MADIYIYIYSFSRSTVPLWTFNAEMFFSLNLNSLLALTLLPHRL